MAQRKSQIVETHEAHLDPIDEISYVFDLMDRDRDGRISATELASVLECLGEERVDETVQAMMSQADTDRDGYVDFDEFLRVSQSTYGCCWPSANEGNNFIEVGYPQDDGERGDVFADCDGPSVEDFESAFRLFDRDGDGYVSAEELREVMAGIWEEDDLTVGECEAMLLGVDADGDGRLSFVEFAAMMGWSIRVDKGMTDKGASVAVAVF